MKQVYTLMCGICVKLMELDIIRAPAESERHPTSPDRSNVEHPPYTEDLAISVTINGVANAYYDAVGVNSAF